MVIDRLNLVKKFFRRFKRLPSYSEMLKLFNLSSKKSIHDIVHEWIEEDLLKMEKGKLAPTSKFFSIPLLGLVKAGYPILADENKEYVSLDEYLIEDPHSSFLLKVSGDSLTGVGIFDGDYVVIEKRKNAYPGDLVLAEIDKEWTLKILRKERHHGKIYLQAANPKYPPLYPHQELQIFGVVKAVIRKIVN